LKLDDNFFKTIVPGCFEATEKNQKLIGLLRSQGIEQSFIEHLQKMDEAEFRVLLARVVISASSKGVVGADLTEKIAFLSELRQK
jgi:hypothetical protein